MFDPAADKSSTRPLAFLPPELLWEAIVDSSDDAIISKNLQGIIISWNKSAERIFGYTASEMLGQSILRLLPPDRQEEEARILSRLQRGERVDHYETVRVRKDGRRIDVSLSISPIRDAEGVVIGASKIARDISDQKRAVQQLAEANEQLQRANRMKAEFISTLSHELRTPLTAMLGWIQLFKENPTPDDLSQGIEVVERNIRIQSQLIEDLLDMSRIEAGKIALDIQRLDLAAVVSAAIEAVQPSADVKSVRLTSAFSSVEGVVMGDKNRVQQVVWNLLTNAIKFTPKGGRIHVTLERINSHVEIAVADSGAGIAPEFLDHVFERFSQADSSTTRTHGGLGLGLSIVKKLVELHGGTVRAKSAGRDQGSTFIVCLPLVPVRQEPELAPIEERNTSIDERVMTADLDGLNVLVVDDDPDSAEIVCRIIERNGADVRTAGSMDEALVIFNEFTPDVLLSDIGMPDHDGYELISRIRALPAGRSLPAVALTALARSADRTRALRAGFQMHVAKPVDASELVAVVRNLASLRAR
jgi:PAS domain S-box-containing protein